MGDFVIAMLAGFFGLGVVVVAALAAGADAETLIVVGSIGQYAAHLLAIFWLIKHRTGADLGFRVQPSDVIWTGLGVVLQVAVPVLFLPFANLIGNGEGGQAIGDEIGQLQGLGARVGIAVIVAVVAPITEELLFRGILLQAVIGKGRGRAMWSTAAIFALFHVFGLTGDLGAGLALIVPTFLIMGLVLARVTLRRQRLGPAIFIHSGFNLLALVVLFLPPELVSQLST
jgi:membrane protease YdiL (CAAX protease family)